MQILKIIVSIIIIVNNFFIFASSQNEDKYPSSSVLSKYHSQCTEVMNDKDSIIVDWYPIEPYQFGHIKSNGNYSITGLDIELINALSNKIGIGIKYDESIWDRALSDIQNGESDVLAGATETDERSAFAEFSIPYRFEEISLFTLRASKKQLNFNNINEFLAQTRLLNFRLGIMKGAVYGDMKISNYLNQINNNDIIFKYETISELFNSLIRKEIDGFLADKIEGIALILNYIDKDLVQETPTGIKTPIHLMFSKKTISHNLVERFNNAIKEFIDTNEYRKIVKSYIYNVLLPQSINSEWCYIIEMIGSIAFAISGITIATKKNATLFETFLIAILPSLFGCILLDIIIKQASNSLLLTPAYLYRVFILVIISFVTVRFLDHYNKGLYEDPFIRKIWSNILIISDALGQASFIIIGVVIATIRGIEPLEFWGPCFACLTSNTGLIARNLVVNYSKENSFILREVNFEISILWGLIFSILLNAYAYNPDYNTIRYSIITVITGAFISKLIIYYYNIPNLTFHNNELENSKEEISDKL